MKVTLVIFSLTCFVAVFALPAGRDSSEEVEFVSLEDQTGRPIVDTGVIGGGPWMSPFDGLFESFAAMMARMRQQMDYLLRRLPFRNGTLDSSPFPGFEFPEIDLSKGNSTSVTKVIDGHKVVINETEYKQEGDNGGAFFKVRIIDVLPDSSELTTEKNAETITTSPKEPESVENSFENEIPKNREIEELSSGETFDEIETFNEYPMKRVLPQYQPFQKLTNWESVERLDDSIESNAIDSGYRQPDLSRDIYVNQLMADAGVPPNPNAEVFSDTELSGPQTKRFEKMMISPR